MTFLNVRRIQETKTTCEKYVWKHISWILILLVWIVEYTEAMQDMFYRNKVYRIKILCYV